MNALAELLKQLIATSFPAKPSMPFTGIPPNMQSGIVSRLSAEFYHTVYSHLNIPVGGHVWITGRVAGAVTDTSHIIFYADAKWPMRVHAPFENYRCDGRFIIFSHTEASGKYLPSWIMEISSFVTAAFLLSETCCASTKL